MADEALIQAVWDKGQIEMGHDRELWRKDECGAWIGREWFNYPESQYGWVIDLIDVNGSDDLSNLRPLQWENKAEKINGCLKCNVTASGRDNIERTK